MSNRDIQAASHYHEQTKHSYQSVRSNPHYLDWSTQPVPFKAYPGLEPIPLPRRWNETEMAALSAISELTGAIEGERIPDLNDLARLLYFSIPTEYNLYGSFPATREATPQDPIAPADRLTLGKAFPRFPHKANHRRYPPLRPPFDLSAYSLQSQ